MSLNPVHRSDLPTDLINAAGRIKQAIADGAAANTNIAVAGIATNDKLIGVINLTDQDVPPGAAITSAGNIRCTATTAGDKLLVTYYDRSA